MQKFIVQKAQKLRDFTDETYAQGSFAFLRLLRSKDIRVNGVKIGENIAVHPGDEVVYYTTEKEESRACFSEIYRDDNILVADKFSGVNSEALFRIVQQRYGARFIHRLDRNTCGVMVFALSKEAEKELLAAFRERRAEKLYETLCFHPFKVQQGTFTAYLVKDEKNARVKIFEKPYPSAEKIITQYFVRKTIGEYSLVDVCLHSGKTHQIRAHLAFLGNPVVGDEKYGDEILNKKYRVKRHILVAKSIAFEGLSALSYLNGKKFVSSFCAEMPAQP